jgi:phosphatidate cytidylyltransferase
VWQRTRVGALIAAGLALVMWIAARFESAEPVLATCTVLAALCIYEIDRMGALRGRGLRIVLALPLLVVVILTALVVLSRDTSLSGTGLGSSHGALWLPETGLWWLVLTSYAVGLAAVSFAIVRSGSWLLKLSAVAAPALMLAPGDGFEAMQWLASVLFFFVLVSLAFYGPAQRRAEFRSALGLAAWLVPPLPALAIVWQAFGQSGLVALIVLSKIGDTAGYYAGNAMGRHHPFPRISPGKTTEGCVASFVATAACGAALVGLGLLPSARLGLLGGVAAGALINVAAQGGDLLESFVKRRTGVKDSGDWFGPSGGLLDLVDSVLLSIPAALVVWPIFFFQINDLS